MDFRILLYTKYNKRLVKIFWNFLDKNVLVAQSCLFAVPWTVAHQAPLSMGFSRQEYWSELPFRSPGDAPDSGVELFSPALRADSLPSEH